MLSVLSGFLYSALNLKQTLSTSISLTRSFKNYKESSWNIALVFCCFWVLTALKHCLLVEPFWNLLKYQHRSFSDSNYVKELFCERNQYATNIDSNLILIKNWIIWASLPDECCKEFMLTRIKYTLLTWRYENTLSGETWTEIAWRNTWLFAIN